MPILFLILADRLGPNVALASAPDHVFLRFGAPDGRTFNIEATSGGHPARTDWYRKNFPMSDRGLESGIYMRTPTRRETVALIWTPRAGHIGRYTPVVGRAAGRLIPFIGAGMLAYDAVKWRRAPLRLRAASFPCDRHHMLSDRVLFIDGEAIVVDKPAGLPVDPPRDGALSVASHLESLAFGFVRWPQAVHRLDRDTSGCLLLSRNPKAHARFQRAFEERGVEKIYWAVVDGVPADEAGTVDAALSKTSSREAGWRMVVDARGKDARTHWRVLLVRGGKTLIEMRPETGRTHQLRVHAVHGLRMPIVGDAVYGRGGTPMLLHARSLRVERGNKVPVEAVAPVPAGFIQAGWSDARPHPPIAAHWAPPSPVKGEGQ